MRLRKLTDTGDYSWGHGLKNFYIDQPEGIAQNVRTSLLLWLGEWYLDITQGTPYMQGILGKHDKTLADLTIQDQVLGVDGVTGISNYVSTIDPDTRSMSVQFNLITIYGPTPVQVENYADL